MSWRAQFGTLSLIVAIASCTSAPKQREPLIGQDARGAQQLEMMRQQEIAMSSSASISDRIEAHAKLGQYLLTTADEARHERAKRHLSAATSLWPGASRALSESEHQRVRRLVAAAFISLGELSAQELQDPPKKPRHASVMSSFREAFTFYRNASYHAQQAKAFGLAVRAEYRRGELLEQLAEKIGRHHDRRRRQSYRYQAMTQYKLALRINLPEEDVEGQRWRRLAQQRLCVLDKVYCEDR